MSIDGIRSVALFEGTLREAIHRFKYDHVRDLADSLGGFLVAFWQETTLPADVVVPVPLHARRIKERGYNQARLLAERLGEAAGIPVLCEALYRNRHTASQTGLSAQERRRNVNGAFSCSGSGVQGKRVLLVDDVCTTGATLEACSVALREGGAQSVWALTVARAV
jgi:ComF family protein